jgi:uncharacterized protein (DUF1015 family)
MAEIRPFKAWRYNYKLRKQIDELTSPLFDVVSEKQRARLYQHPHNSIHLSVPQGENAAWKAGQTLQRWKDEKVIVQDMVPGIYSYFQYFTLPGDSKEYCRKGFVAFIRAYDWSDKVLMRHESTMPHSVDDRVAILEETKLNVSPTHGLYTDPDFQIEAILDASIQQPIYEAEDYQGVRDVLGVVNDVESIRKIVSIMRDKQIILADGHHRYEGSLRYKKMQLAKGPTATGKEAFNYHMMYFTNTEAHDLRILPTHRLVKNIPDFAPAQLLEKLAPYFIIKPVENASDVNEIILGKQWAFGLLVGDEAYKIRLKPECIDLIDWHFPDKIKELDLTVMHYFIFEKILGIAGKDQTRSEKITFERNFTECHSSVLSGDAQFAVITRDISIETIKEVCLSGYTLPQKSTYFYPKVICGFLFGSIQEDEFTSPFDSSL